ncbi:MAG: AAA family ATPase [Candidatus Aminicenantes bacterium]|nr:AAA family ATPase [Candidatus Aminicenantes bacterium]
MLDTTILQKAREEPLYVGLTGTMASGKGEIAKIFKNLNFAYISLSDIVREEAGKRGKDNMSRHDLQNLGNELRKNGGTDIIARRVRDKIIASNKKAWIIDGIRNPAEVLELKKLRPFYLIGIKSDLEIILKRIQSRKRQTDRVENSELEKLINREWGVGESSNGQRVGECIQIADFIIENNQGLNELKKKCLDIISIIEDKNA